ncbi:hypothetical protein RHGRI_028170 [Rhododendron griersonianum]|uniref:Uncharacterized protein n=1 Tax=Rhododendron griersonianum TaxID=479676 RepID=A0AAV6II75_9ERIC|nr:hypothetical protein RHGRI_028170 [Rhododendron griersonianum]
MPKIGYTPEEWLTPLGDDEVFEPVLPGINVPLKVVEPNADEMSRRGIPRPVIPTKTANPAWNRSSLDQQDQQREKRQKTTEDSVPPSNSQPIVLDETRAPAPKEQQNASKVSAERERYRTVRDSYRAKFRVSKSQLKETEAEVGRLKKELADAKATATNAEVEMKKIKGEEKGKLKQADAKGYEAEIKRTAIEYTQTAHKMVNDELEMAEAEIWKWKGMALALVPG